MTRHRKKIVTLVVVIALISGGFVAVSADRSQNRTTESQYTMRNPTLEWSQETPYASSLQGRELFFKMMLSVLLVFVLGAAAIYISRKLMPRITNSPGKQIHILETAHLGPRKAVHLIEIRNQKSEDRKQRTENRILTSDNCRLKTVLLIGSTNENITTLADVTSTLAELPTQEVEDSHFVTDCKMGTPENNVRI